MSSKPHTSQANVKPFNYKGVAKTSMKDLVRFSERCADNKIKKQTQLQKTELKAQKQLLQKYSRLNSNLEKISQALTAVYIDGKIKKDEYLTLQKRTSEIFDVVIFGKTLGIRLAKRYVTGKIDKNTFEEMKNEIVPQDVIDEECAIKKSFEVLADRLDNFLEHCDNKNENNCFYCGKEPRFFSPIVKCMNVKLCRLHKRELDKLRRYVGFNGKYFTVYSFDADSSYSETIGNTQVHLKSEWY